MWCEKKGVTLHRKKIDMKARQTRLWILLVMCSLSMMVRADSLIKLQPERLPDMTIPRLSHSTFIDKWRTDGGGRAYLRFRAYEDG